MKECKICKMFKDDYKFRNGINKKTSAYLSVKTCRECRNEKDRDFRKNNPEIQKKRDRKSYQNQQVKKVQYARDYRVKYPDRTRKTNWKCKYGITPEDFYAKLKEQNNKCAICERDADEYTRIFSVDHNHKTGVNRGLVCDPCNYGLGFYEKHKEKYIKYLEKYPH